jgi:uncharacterized protein (TIGR03118 family)
MKNMSWSRVSRADHNGPRTCADLQFDASSTGINPSQPKRRIITVGGLALLCIATTLRLSAENGPPQHYLQTNLVSDVPGLAAATDPNLVNAWGLSRSAGSPWWVADNGTGVSTLYTGAGAIIPLVVTIPGVSGPSAPTGTVFNGVATDFLVAPTLPAHFIFATEGGTIAGWNSGLTAVTMVPATGAVYKGLTLGQLNGANMLYAANFAAGTVDVFDNTFTAVKLAAGAFKDWQIPADYAPFNVQSIGSWIYVTFAKKEAGSIDEVHGPGKGYVDAFSTDGVLQKRLRWGAWFNAPWGVALAPWNFGGFSNMILVGNFGSGKIAAFDPVSGEFRGLVRTAHGRPMIIEGLWALSFGNGAGAGPTNSLYFTAGIDDEAHGLFGTITAP